MVAAGVLSFASSFGFNWSKQQKIAAAAVLPKNTAPTDGDVQRQAADAQTPRSFVQGQRLTEDQEQMGLSERQLQHLIYDIREKMREHAVREKELNEESRRIDVARKSLQEDIEHLNMLREKLDMSLAAIKEKEEAIHNTLIEIEVVERSNFQRLAATYERMDVTQAGKIMLSMAASNQLQDVVKILYYMGERNAGRLLGEIGSTRPEIAGILSIQLKRVHESE